MSTEAGPLQEALAEGRLALDGYCHGLMDQMERDDAEVSAWASLSREALLDQARRLDELRHRGSELGRFFGMPIAVKDIFDTADFPTGWGLPGLASGVSTRDATVVERLRAEGALLPGKAQTSPLASRLPSATRHPTHPDHTPGASSAGPAVAVALGHAVFGVGSQTAASITRPASYCGVWGYKPSRGLVSRAGMLLQSPTLDQVGFFARDLAVLAVGSEICFGPDARDKSTAQAFRPQLCRALAQPWAAHPRFGMLSSTFHEELDPEMAAAMLELSDSLGGHAEPHPFDHLTASAIDWHRTVHWAEMAQALGPLETQLQGEFPSLLSAQMAEGRQMSAVDYLHARQRLEHCAESLGDTFFEFDVLVGPATLGPAPLGTEDTGSPKPAIPWTALGLPTLSVPLFRSSDGRPMGVQLVGPPGGDARLFSVAQWLLTWTAEA